MKRLTGLTLTLTAALTFVVQAGAQTLYNASFEQEGESSDVASSWSRWGNWMNRETGWTPVRDGECLIGYHHWEITEDSSSGFYQDTQNADPAKEYTFKVYAMRDDPGQADECAPASVELRLESTVDGKQVVVASKSYTFDELSTTLGGSWSPLRVSGKPKNNTLRVLVIVEPCKGTKRGGSIKFDDASLLGE